MVRPSWRSKLGAGRGGLSVVAYATSVAASIYPLSTGILPVILVLAACAWNAFLFWPEIRTLRIVLPKGAIAQPIGWLYFFALANVGLLLLGGTLSYFKLSHVPRSLTSDEFSQPYISGKYFHIADLADTSKVIAGRTFENDWIYGPAVVVASGSDIRGSSFNGTFDQIFQPVQPDQPIGVGVIVISDGKFRNCHFVNVTFVATPSQIDSFRRSNSGAGTSTPGKEK